MNEAIPPDSRQDTMTIRLDPAFKWFENASASPARAMPALPPRPRQRLAGQRVKLSDGDVWRLDTISVAHYGREHYDCDAGEGFHPCRRRGAYWLVLEETEQTLVACRPHAIELVKSCRVQEPTASGEGQSG